jgi:hypothetical protein
MGVVTTAAVPFEVEMMVPVESYHWMAARQEAAVPAVWARLSWNVYVVDARTGIAPPGDVMVVAEVMIPNRTPRVPAAPEEGAL